MSELKWWEQTDQVNDSNEDGVPDDNTSTNPIRDAHYDQLDVTLKAMTDELHVGLLERFKNLYDQRNVTGIVTKDNFMGLGLTHPNMMETILVEESKLRLSQIYHKYIHGLYIPQYRVGDRLIEMETLREFIVDTAPNHTAALSDHGFVYHLKAVDTGLQEIRSAAVVECTHFIRKQYVESIDPVSSVDANYATQELKVDSDGAHMHHTSTSGETVPFVYDHTPSE